MSNLLGAWQSNLTLFHYEELLALLQQAVQAGDYGGGSLFDQSDVLALQQQGQDFASLPSIPAGSRADAYSLEYPFDLLKARFAAIVQEKNDFLARLQGLLDQMDKSTILIDQLLAAAYVKYWVATRPPLTGALQFYLDFSESHGEVPATKPMLDPATGIIQTRNVVDSAVFSGSFSKGIAPPSSIVQSYSPISLVWTYPAAGTPEELYAPDSSWASLSILTTQPELVFSDPVVSVLAPPSGDIAGVFAISGQQIPGSLAYFVRTLFHPRLVSLSLTLPEAGQPTPLSRYSIDVNDIIVTDSEQSYEQGFDYDLDTNGNLTPRTSLGNAQVTVLFTEYYPAYQCSTNQTEWSPVVMLDPLRPFPDDATSFFHLPVGANGEFPLMDEANTLLGTTIRMLDAPKAEYVIQIQNSARQGYGLDATLEIEFDKPAYMNGVSISPFTNYPARLRGIIAEGLLDQQSSQILTCDIPLDRPMTVEFPDQLIRRMSLVLHQDNYLYEQTVISPASQLRTQWLAKLENVLPLPARARTPIDNRVTNGVQYDFGLGPIAGVRRAVVLPTDTGVFISGPYTVAGTPDVLRFDADVTGSVSFYLSDIPRGTSGNVLDSVFGADVQITNGGLLVYRPASGAVSVDFFVKFVLASNDAMVERFLLQVREA